MLIAWLAGTWKAGAWKAGAWESSDQAVAVSGARLRRKRVFIDGQEYFLNPQEVANLLVERAAKAAEETEATADELHADVLPACIQAIDYEAIKASGVKASQAFIDRMNTEIERLQRMEIQRQIEEEDDIECLMLLMV